MRARTTSRTAAGTRSADGSARASSPTKNGLPPDRRATAATTSGSGRLPNRSASAAPTAASSHPESSITSPPGGRSSSVGRAVATTSSRARCHLPGHVGEQRHRVRVGPLHVVEDEDEPGVLGDRGEEAGDGVEEREPVALDGLAGQLGSKPRDLAQPDQCRGGAITPDQREP